MVLSKRNLFAGAAILPMLLTATALAASFTISNGQTETTQQTLSDPNDTGTIESGGTVSTTGINNPAVQMSNTGQSTTNSGSISTTGRNADGIYSSGSAATITNGGSISITGENAFGIYSRGATARITNSGTIATTGDSSGGIYSSALAASITNSGTISTKGNSAFGIASNGATATISNSGTIRTTRDDASGIYSTDATASITNSGSISTTGEDAYGIRSEGDTASITNSGAINTTGNSARGIDSSGDTASITNSGTISTARSYAYGIYSDGLNATITNSGSISTAGEDAYGFYADGLNATITNSGSVNTTGEDAIGINSEGPTASITNSGRINATGKYGYGINSSGANAAITNSGSISTAGQSARGIYTGNSASITNSGSISTTGEGAHGIDVSTKGSANTTVINTGTISTTGVDAIGIDADGSVTATVTNSGTVISQQSDAFHFGSANGTLNLLPGTLIQGGMTFEQPATATLNIGPGFANAAFTLTGMPTTINTNGQPYVVSGNIVALVNPTGFDGASTMLTQSTRAIADVIDSHSASPASGGTGPSSALGYAASNGNQATSATATMASAGQPTANGLAWWSDVFGGYRHQGNRDYVQGGVIAGLDGSLAPNTTAGVFVGAATGRPQGTATRTDSTSLFGGAYLDQRVQAMFAKFAVTGGVMLNNRNRQVLNNLAPGGFDTASANFNGFFISPSVTVGIDQQVKGMVITPSLRLRYAGLFQNGYSETGSIANLTIGNQNTHVLEVRAQLNAALDTRHTENGDINTSVRAGVDGIFTRGDAITANLLGTGLTLAGSTNTSEARGFVGLDTAFNAYNGVNFTAGVEAGYSTTNAFTVSANIGAKGRF
ncbi:autotransporter domain-containing protein [Devosia algicola]|uniref:Autotransporter domain-containing protein n=1 Tax=Devosia algicola TaxID=3026418 RepID=A0ABY7YT54_9HYPH|nr:autotransporter domain-containing protein [Devosia algicola]WDR04035.1 autotransporter domain-containing protein [Devosia algicola]